MVQWHYPIQKLVISITSFLNNLNQIPSNPDQMLILSIGMLVGFVFSFILIIILLIKNQKHLEKYQKLAKAANVTLPKEKGCGFYLDPSCGLCCIALIAIIVIGVLAVFGISIPQIPQELLFLITSVSMILFVWILLPLSIVIYYYRSMIEREKRYAVAVKEKPT